MSGRADLSDKLIAERSGRTLVKKNLHDFLRRARRTEGLRREQALFGVKQNRLGLRSRDAGKPFEELIEGRPAFKILEQGRHGNPRTFEYPRAADFISTTFNGIASVPIHHISIVSLEMG